MPALGDVVSCFLGNMRDSRTETHLAVITHLEASGVSPGGFVHLGKTFCQVNARSEGRRLEDFQHARMASCVACWEALPVMVQAYLGWNYGKRPD